jgi:hypothetical protein
MTKSQSTRFAEAPLQLELPFGAFSPVDAPAADPDPPAVERQARAEEQTDEQADFVNSYIEDRRIRAAEAHAAFSPHEFGSLQGRTPPGQDPQVLVHLTTRIAEEVRPDNVLDRLLVADIAKDTVFADFLFGGLLDAYACQEEDTARELAASAAAGGEKGGLSAERELRGRTFIKHHAVMGRVYQMHAQVRATRDTATTALTARRLEALKAALTSAEETMRG